MRRRPFRKLTVEECIGWSISSLVRAGIFRAPTGTLCDSIWRNSHQKEILRIVFRCVRAHTGCRHVRTNEGAIGTSQASRHVDSQSIEIVQTRLQFGLRHWFRCPGLPGRPCCAGRAGILYLPPNERRFACRICHDLTYESVQRHDGRVNRLLQLPAVDFQRILAAGTIRERLLCVRACTHLYRKLAKHTLARKT